MFTDNVKPRKRGRPRGRTGQGDAARTHLYDTAVALIAEQGYEATTLRQVAERAGVSGGLLYRYFPSKRAVVLALYETLSLEYAGEAGRMRPGRWRDRFMFALDASLRVLSPHRATLSSLTPILVGDPHEGVFSHRTMASRLRVQEVFHGAIAGATDAPPAPIAEAAGRLLYLAHLGVILWWLLDRSPKQRATAGLVALIARMLPSLALTLRLPPIRGFVRSADELFRDALFERGEAGSAR